jgi:hypothetical protein
MNRLMNWLRKPSSRRPSPAPRPRKVRLGVEQLDDRVVPTVIYGVFDNGTFVRNTSLSTGWQQITPYKPSVMTEGSYSEMYGTYGDGTWRYDYNSSSWTKLTPELATNLSATYDNALFGSFTYNGSNTGTWEYSPKGVWTQITSRNALQLAGVRDGWVYGTYGQGADGTWQYKDGGWTEISTNVASVLSAAADASGTLYASFSTGTWGYNTSGHPGSWTRYTTAVATALAGVDSLSFFGSYSSGTWEYKGAGSQIGWQQIYTQAATALSASENYDLYASFSTGTYEWNGAWYQLTPAQAGELASGLPPPVLH